MLGVKDLLGKGRRDDSGDFTNGANLNKAQIDHILQFINMKQDNNFKTLNNIKVLVGDSSTGKQGIKEIEKRLKRLFKCLRFRKIKNEYTEVQGSW